MWIFAPEWPQWQQCLWPCNACNGEKENTKKRGKQEMEAHCLSRQAPSAVAVLLHFCSCFRLISVFLHFFFLQEPCWHSLCTERRSEGTETGNCRGSVCALSWPGDVWEKSHLVPPCSCRHTAASMPFCQCWGSAWTNQTPNSPCGSTPRRAVTLALCHTCHMLLAPWHLGLWSTWVLTTPFFLYFSAL